MSFSKGTANDNSITYAISGTPDNIYNQNITISNGTLTCDVCLVITPIDATKSLKFELVNSTINVNDKSTFNFTIQSYNYTFSSSELRLNGDPENELLFNMDEGTFTLTNTAHAGILSLSISDSTNIVNSNMVHLDITDNVVRNLPMTTNFFTFKNSNPNTKIITGYALNFLSACDNSTLLNAYLTDHGATGVNGLCFSDYHLAGTQYLLSPSKTGYEKINNFYKTLINLDFSNTIFDWCSENNNVSNATGWLTFDSSNFESVTNINFLNTNFTPTLTSQKDVRTAYGTFQSATFKELTNLNLSGAIFAAPDMTFTSLSTNMAKVYSACETFKSATFTTLSNLNLSGAVFATPKMTNSNEIYTAASTFQSATFTALTNLNLSGVIFAATNMNTTFTLHIACETFISAKFTLLTNLNLSGAVFATPYMNNSVV
ncbi:hypothetical protein FACS189459_2220 [Bacilli bacterium]|nr:hypothetical protein FACS189459_2220 [Bacilli bacterium]